MELLPRERSCARELVLVLGGYSFPVTIWTGKSDKCEVIPCTFVHEAGFKLAYLGHVVLSQEHSMKASLC